MAIENKPGTTPQPGQPNQPTPSAQSPQSRPSAQPVGQPQAQQSAQNDDEGDGLRAAVQEGYQARTTVPGHEGVDARLDNRAGAFRPPLEQWPAKPQQIDGPDLAGQIEFTRKHLQGRGEEQVSPRKGQFSPGPHGLSDAGLRETDEPLYGTESLSEGDVASGARD